MSFVMRWLMRTVLVAVLLLSGLPIAGHAQGQPTTVVIVDGSGSMWGRLAPDNRAKVDIVREKLAPIIESAIQTRVGLVSFGHRRRGDCSDVEVIAAPDAPREIVLDQLAKLNPRGRGPLVSALKTAGEALGSSRPGQIVVINDGIDNCQLDACQAARDYAVTAPDVPIHVVSIGIAANEQPLAKCIADATKGRYFDVQDSDALVAALDEVGKIALLSPGSSGKPGVSAAPQPPAGATLRVSASLAKGGPLLNQPIAWRIFKTGDDKVLGDNVGRDFTLKLAPGRYDVEAKLQSITARETITIESGNALGVVLPLNASHLAVRASAIKGGEPSPTAILTLSSGDTPIAIGRSGVLDLFLPPSRYTVIVADGAARISEAVALKAGDDNPLDVVLGTGRLELTANAADSTLLSDVLFAIFEDDPESPTGRREVARSRAANARFTLPSGTYYVSARSGAAEVRERIAIGAGDAIKRSINLALASLSVTTTIAGTPAGPEHGLVYRVERLDGSKNEVARVISPKLSVNLPPGRYKVTARATSYTLSASAELALEPGAKVEKALEMAGAEVRFSPPAQSNAGEIYWEVIDASGAPVWHATGTQAKAVLAPGRYVVRLESRSKRNQAAFDVKAGENQVIEIGPG